MGYLHVTSSTMAGFEKAVISFWFRIPSATLSAVVALSDTSSDPDALGDGWDQGYFYPGLFKIIPLFTFGSIENILAGADESAGLGPISPSFIGIDCSNIGGSKTSPTLAVNLQTASVCSFNKSPQAPENEYRPECYYMRGWGGEPGTGSEFQSLDVTPDVWHHALISFDLSTGCSITWASGYDRSLDTSIPIYSLSPGPMFSWAFDDAAKVGMSMTPSCANIYTFGDDGSHDTGPGGTAPIPALDNKYILPNGFFNIPVAGDYTATPIEDSTAFTISASGGITQLGCPMGIGASADWVSSICKLEMAEFQLFTGVYLDLTVEENRRAFITSAGKPASPALAQSLLSKAPEILFQTSNDWITGNNRGTAGPLTPVGTISAYSPSPS